VTLAIYKKLICHAKHVTLKVMQNYTNEYGVCNFLSVFHCNCPYLVLYL